MKCLFGQAHGGFRAPIFGSADYVVRETSHRVEYPQQTWRPETGVAERTASGDDCTGLRTGPGAEPESCWRAPAADATDAELETIYGSLGQPIVAYGHTHRPAIRSLAGRPELLINTGSVGLPYDGDPRASYLLLDGTISRFAESSTMSRRN